MLSSNPKFFLGFFSYLASLKYQNCISTTIISICLLGIYFIISHFSGDSNDGYTTRATWGGSSIRSLGTDQVRLSVLSRCEV